MVLFSGYNVLLIRFFSSNKQVSPVYGPPEALRDRQEEKHPRHPLKWDVYSFGVFLYEMYEGRGFFESLSIQNLREEVIHGRRPVMTPAVPEAIQRIIQCAWAQDPSTFIMSVMR